MNHRTVADTTHNSGGNPVVNGDDGFFEGGALGAEEREAALTDVASDRKERSTGFFELFIERLDRNLQRSGDPAAGAPLWSLKVRGRIHDVADLLRVGKFSLVRNLTAHRDVGRRGHLTSGRVR